MARKLSRRSLAEYVAEGALTSRRSKVIKQLAAYLVDTRRTSELGLIVRDAAFYLSQKGIVGASVVSASELSAETKEAITEFISTRTKATTVGLDATVDPTVLGGVRISIPGYELDHTVRQQLTALKTRFRKA